MPVFLASLLGGLVSATGTFVGRALISLGISYVVYRGIEAGMEAFKAKAFAALGGVSAFPVAADLAGVLQIGTCLNILFSAYLTKLVLSGMSASGSLTKMVVKS